MTIREALEQPGLHSNTFTDHEKRLWLSELDSRIKTQVLDRYGGADAPFGGYGDDTPADARLLAEPPFDQMYPCYLEAKIHYHNAEYDRYNNAMAMFQAVFDDFRRHYSRTRTAAAAAFRYF